MHVKTPSKLPIMFELTQEARDSNMKILKEVNYDIEELISRFTTSEIGHGSELRPHSMLKHLLQCRKNWKRIESFFSTGINVCFHDMDDKKRI